MQEFLDKDVAVVFGNTGGIGSSIFKKLKEKYNFHKVLGFSRNSNPNIDINNEKTFAKIANEFVKNKLKIKLLINTIGFLHDNYHLPEKKFQDLDASYMQKSFAINTIPTALIIKYFTPLMENNETSVMATLSAKVGSITDNYLGGWYSYRASKAALNQLIKTASIEYKRKNKNLIIVAIHPGTVSTKLSKPFLSNKNYQTTDEASNKIINVLKNLTLEDSGLLIDYNKNIIPY